MASSGFSIESLYGTWRLVSWKRRLLDSGETLEAFGSAPRGFLSYGSDGRMFWIMTKEGRARPDDLEALTEAQRQRLRMGKGGGLKRRQPSFSAQLVPQRRFPL